MSKNQKPRKKAPGGKPLSQRKAIIEANQGLVKHVSGLVQQLEQRVAQSNQQLWKNQQAQNVGLRNAEHHAVIMRRVMNDALSGVTRVKRITRPSQEDMCELNKIEDVHVIDWTWYTHQLDAALGLSQFAHMVRQHEQAIIKRRWKVAEEAADVIIRQGDSFAEELAENDDVLGEFLQTRLAEETDQEFILIQNIVKILIPKKLLKVRTERAKELADKKFEEISKAVAKIERIATPKTLQDLAERIEAGEDIIKDESGTEIEMDAALRSRTVALLTSLASEDVVAAKKELQKEMEDVAEVAREAIEAIKGGDEETAAARMEELERRAAAAEKKEEPQPVPKQEFPDGAAIFGE